MKKTTFLLILFSVIFFSQPGAQGKKIVPAQEKGQETLQYEVMVTLKLIQVFVTDGKGNPVTDLTQADFILYDNGKLKTITDFEKHLLPKREKKRDEKAELEPEKKVREEVLKTEPLPAREIPSRMNRKFFLLLDIFKNDVVGMKNSKKAALHFIDTQVQPTDEVCVISYYQDRGLILHEYLTTDHEKAREAVRRIRGVPGLMAEIDRRKLDGEWIKMKTRQFALEMKEFAKSLRYIPGFKNIIFFSGGISRSLLYDAESETAESILEMPLKDPGVLVAYEDMCKELASSNSPVYTVNTKSTARSLLDTTDRGERGDHSLQMLSDISGGKYYPEVEYYEKISEEIQNVTGNYYVLGYYIDEKWDGKYHEIKVEVKRKGCRVFAQGGYFNPKPFTEFSEFEKQLHLFDLAFSEKPYFQEPLSFPSVALPFPGIDGSNVVLVSEIMVDRIKEVVKERIEVITLILDKDNNMFESRRREIQFSTTAGNTVYPCLTASLEPGEYECRVVIRGLRTGKGAVGASSVAVPEPLESGIRLYPPLLLVPERKAQYLKFSKEQEEDYPYLTDKHAPVVEEVDRGVPKLLAVVMCSLTDIQDPEVELTAHLVHQPTGKEMPYLTALIDRSQETYGQKFLLELRTAGLEPGEYDLYLVAAEKNTGSKSQASSIFRVK